MPVVDYETLRQQDANQHAVRLPEPSDGHLNIWKYQVVLSHLFENLHASRGHRNAFVPSANKACARSYASRRSAHHGTENGSRTSSLPECRGLIWPQSHR